MTQILQWWICLIFEWPYNRFLTQSIVCKTLTVEFNWEATVWALAEAMQIAITIHTGSSIRRMVWALLAIHRITLMLRSVKILHYVFARPRTHQQLTPRLCCYQLTNPRLEYYETTTRCSCKQFFQLITRDKREQRELCIFL